MLQLLLLLLSPRGPWQAGWPAVSWPQCQLHFALTPALPASCRQLPAFWTLDCTVSVIRPTQSQNDQQIIAGNLAAGCVLHNRRTRSYAELASTMTTLKQL